ncbi:MAG: nucleoside hydrolase, partial [Caulobacterales bacterium]|nr:nucleoside hydrolase [Caulobacterales bacterium]
LAFAAPEDFDILGVTAVAGNVGLDLTARNARIIRELAGREEVPVFAGCPRPLVRAPVAADEFHGKTGMDGMSLFEPKRPLADGHAVDFIVDTLNGAADEAITLVVTGPFTNIAMAIVKDPSILPKIKEIVVMGGAMREGGNITPSAEFNVYADPHAAHVLFACGRPIVAIGLDATHQVLATPERRDAIRAIGTAPAEAAAGMLDFVSHVEKQLKKYEGAPLHDPCTIAYLLAPQLFTGRLCDIAVEIGSPATAGHTAVDIWNTTGREPNALWIEAIDAAGLFDLLTERLKRL